jgi:GTP-binding protein
MFIDEACVFVKSGKGGDGMVHFHREKYVPRGGPDGGDGGKGGDVVLEVVPTLNTLSNFRHQTRFEANSGAAGGPNNMSGKSASDLIIPVPPGTLAFNNDTDELIGDLVSPGQRLVVCKGGRGGRGNQHFASSRNQVPRMGEKGAPAEELNLRLELKLIADVGLVGVPNAGKSSLLAAVSNARPKIAPYPFTTLEPNLGVVEMDLDHTMIIADIPGLIEGAHMGVGLGDAFLRHIQRTRVLIHILDGMSEDPIADFSQINSEMALFDPDLVRKPQVVAFNKMDLPDVQEKWAGIKKTLEKKGYEVYSISAAERTDLRPLLWRAYQLIQDTQEPTKSTELPVYRAEEDPRAFEIFTDEDGYHVTGKSIERAAAMTYWEHVASVRRFHKILNVLGIEDALIKAGVQEGDTVFIGDYELEWSD